MIDSEDREILQVRLRFIDLIKSFFIDQPDAERMSRWRGTFSALTKEQISPGFDRSVKEIHQFLESKNLHELQDEYYHLFTDPFSEEQINTAASFYMDGRSYGQTLVDLRSLLAEAGFEKKEEVSEAEDSLVIMLDVMTRLIEEEKNTGSGQAKELQAKLLWKYLVPFSEKLTEACRAQESAEFYQACSAFYVGYLDLEKGFLEAVE
jgi:TorA maturation chaperone TorD